MKKSMSIAFLVLISVLTSCFSTMTELFYLPIEEDTYVLHETSDKFIINTMGDYSFLEIKLFEI